MLVLSGRLLLAEDDGEVEMLPGEYAAFPANSGNGHCLKNPGPEVAAFLVVGTRAPVDEVHYPDIDLHLTEDGGFRHKDGTPWPDAVRRR